MCKICFPLAFIAIFSFSTIALGQSKSGPQFQISDCSTAPFQANVAGATYTVTQGLAFPETGDCIDVTAPGITIDLNGYPIGGNCSCNGIVIFKSAPGTHLVGGGSNIGDRYMYIGIHDLGDFALIEDVNVFGAVPGIFLDKVSGSVVNRVSVTRTLQGVGIQLLDTKHCIVENSSANGNGAVRGGPASGILVGDSGDQSLSMNNVIVGNQASNNVPTGITVGGTANTVVSNTADNNNGLGNDGQGIYSGVSQFLKRQGNDNLIIGNSASGNTYFDAYDSNTNCGKDRWVSNQLGTRNQTCIR